MNAVSVGLIPLVVVWLIAGTVLSVIDVRTHRLPNAIVLRLYPVVALALVAAGLIDRTWPVQSALIGAGIWLGLLGLVWAGTGGSGMGFGDVKLAPLLGASLGWVGWEFAVVGLIAAWVLGGLWAGVLMLCHRATRASVMAFGPFLVGGFWLALLAWPSLSSDALQGMWT